MYDSKPFNTGDRTLEERDDGDAFFEPGILLLGLDVFLSVLFA